MAERLQALMENQQRLLTDVSHELCNPLARLQIALRSERDNVRVTLSRLNWIALS